MTVVNGSDSSIVVPTTAGFRSVSQVEPVAGINTIQQFPNMHFEGLNLERISGSLFSGINTRMSPPFIEMTIATATDLAATCCCKAFTSDNASGRCWS